MEDFLRFLITPLVSIPEEIVITQSGSILTLKVADADVGRIIGKKGNVISAIRTLIRTYCTVNHLQFPNLQLDTPVKTD